ncbi:hypothetical protein G6F35_012785 [Rhizopus arrhizus]|nr:hypothetical protein G6F35_012785 [Rhizopus arrhizus]
MRLVEPATGEELGAFVPSNDIDRRLAKDRGYRVGHEYRLEIKASRNAAFHRLAHVIGHLLVDNVEAFRDLDAHAALKQVQLERCWMPPRLYWAPARARCCRACCRRSAPFR